MDRKLYYQCFCLDKTKPIIEVDKWVANKNGNVELVTNSDFDPNVWECGDRFFLTSNLELLIQEKQAFE